MIGICEPSIHGAAEQYYKNILQGKFEKRADLSSPRLPVAAAAGNHRALWLGGGGVGKTRTLRRVVEPLAEAYFGSDGYLPEAQSNLGARNLGPRGRTMQWIDSSEFFAHR